MAEAARKPSRTERTRAALMAAGRGLFSGRPVNAVTVDDIVLAAGLGKGTFYNHFRDRDSLVRDISSEICAGIGSAIGRANAEVEDPARRVARAVCTCMRYALDEPERAQVLIRVYGGRASLSNPLNCGLMVDVSNGLSASRFSMPTVEAGALYVLGIAQLALVRVTRDSTQGFAASLSEQMCGLLLRGLGLPGPEADLIAAQASDDIVRQGAHATTFPAGALN